MVYRIRKCYDCVFRNGDLYCCVVRGVQVRIRKLFRRLKVVPNHRRLRRRLNRLWAEDPNCRFCHKPTLHPIFYTDREKRKLGIRDKLATIEHLDSKNNPLRGTYPTDEPRTTLACWRCNNDRNRAEQESIPIEIKQEASKHD